MPASRAKPAQSINIPTMARRNHAALQQPGRRLL